MDADRERWDLRWSEHGPTDPTDVVARPPDVLDAWPDLLDAVPVDGTALDVACGIGAQSLWMAERGLDVTAIDVSPVALDTLRAAAEGRRLAVRAEVVDADAGLPTDLVDVSLIVCQRFRAQHLYGDFVTRLRPGGMAVVTVLSTVGHQGDTGPFHAPPGELVDTYRSIGDAEILAHLEHAGQASILVRRS